MASSADSLGGHTGDDTGLWSWVTTTNHKRIGVLYLTTSFVFFLAAASMASFE